MAIIASPVPYRQVKAVQKGLYDGVGFEFANGIFGVDLDHVIIDGQLTQEAQDIITTFDSYTEYSPSGTGAHILCRGNIPTGERRRGNIEMYSEGRFFTVTGNAIIAKEVQERTAQAAAVHAKYLKRDEKKQPGSGKGHQAGSLDDSAIMQRAFTGANGTRFKALWEGDTSAYGGDHSRADQALANDLAYWTNGDPGRMDALFRQSGLMRDKWDERRGADTYGNITIAEALRDFIPHQRQGYSVTINKPAQGEPAGPKDGGKPLDGLARFPDEFTDQENAIAFSDMFKEKFYYVSAWGWTAWNGMYWQKESAIEDAKRSFMKMTDSMKHSAIQAMAQAEQGDKTAEARYKWSIKSRNRKQILDGLCLAQACMERAADDFDANAWDLNTPGGIVDMRTGKMRPHDPKALCTCMTKYAPEKKPCPKWNAFLDLATANDTDLKSYLQLVAGMAAIGAVYYEGIVIAHGTGGNRKSTLFNALFGAFGSYATTIAPEILMASKNRSEVTGLAAAQGKRYVLAAETEEGNRLSESTMKRLASTDQINSRFLYHDAITFTPTHTLILATNHLPKIGSVDNGTWRRIMTIPFIKRIEQEQPIIRNYAKVLQDDEGSAIVAWIIEGAKKFYEAGCNITLPAAVLDATQEYRAAEDWTANFIRECCIVDKKHR